MLALRQLDIGRAPFMQWEAASVRDPESSSSRACLANASPDSFEGTPESDETRYSRIERLLSRLREGVPLARQSH